MGKVGKLKISREDKQRECSYCHNWWSIREGYDMESKQCKGCSDWDKDKPRRDAEWKRRMENHDKFANVNFPYVAGDPFW